MENIYCVGLTTLPMNKIVPVVLSWIMYMNGWSARNTGVSIAMAGITVMPVAAAASVPFSFTLIYAL